MGEITPLCNLMPADGLPLPLSPMRSHLREDRMCPVVRLDLLDLERWTRQDLDHLAGARIDALARGRGTDAGLALNEGECADVGSHGVMPIDGYGSSV